MIKRLPDKEPDRPLECSECKKPVAVLYTEVVGETVTRTVMCADCPQLQKRLYGEAVFVQDMKMEKETSLVCGRCGTTLEAIHMGGTMGCEDCYDVFDGIILAEMKASFKVPLKMKPRKKGTPFHLGRRPGEIVEISPSVKLLALNEALTETLKREDYEQAAMLRDQIKEIKKVSEKKTKKKKDAKKKKS